MRVPVHKSGKVRLLCLTRKQNVNAGSARLEAALQNIICLQVVVYCKSVCKLISTLIDGDLGLHLTLAKKIEQQ